MIERDKNGQKTMDSEAALAVRAMPGGDVPSTVEALERLYYRWRGIEVDFESGIVTKRRRIERLRKLQLWIARRPFALFREQVKLMAELITKLLVDHKALIARADCYPAYLKLDGDMRRLRRILVELWPDHIAQAQATDTPLADVIAERLYAARRTPSPEPQRPADLEPCACTDNGRAPDATCELCGGAGWRKIGEKK